MYFNMGTYLIIKIPHNNKKNKLNNTITKPNPTKSKPNSNLIQT
jgi:hypothetical protein